MSTGTVTVFVDRYCSEHAAGSIAEAAAETVGAGAIFAPAVHAQAWSNQPEKGAKLRVLRWSRVLLGVATQLRWVAGASAGYLVIGSLLVGVAAAALALEDQRALGGRGRPAHACALRAARKASA